LLRGSKASALLPLAKKEVVMRTVLVLVVLVALSVAISPAVEAQSTADEAAVRKATEQWFAALNARDAKAAAALTDEINENWAGEVKGRAAREESLRTRFERMPDAQDEMLEDMGVVFVTPDVAVHKFGERHLGRLDADGKPLQPVSGWRAHVYVKKSGRWLRAAQFWRVVEE